MLPMYAPLRRPVDTRAVAEDDCGVAADTGVVPAAPLAAGVVVPLASRAKKGGGGGGGREGVLVAAGGGRGGAVRWVRVAAEGVQLVGDGRLMVLACGRE